MNRNPYEPPKANVSDAAIDEESAVGVTSSDTLYSPNQISVATFLGSPFAAAWFAASNLRAMRQPIKATRILVFGSLATLAVVGVAFVLPDRAPNIVFPLAYSFATRLLAENRFGNVVRDHWNAGGRQGSWWRVVGISFLLALPVMALFFGITFLIASF